jgi:hypothetical protein
MNEMSWREHVKTESQLFEEGEDWLRIIIPEMKDKDQWIPVRVLENYIGYDFKTMDEKLETIRVLEAGGHIEEVIGPIRFHIMEDTKGVPHISFKTPMIAIRE